MNLEVGTLFRWDQFPEPRYGTETKARWFIYLGETGTFSQIALVYLATTTTQIENFQSGETRSGHDHFKFEKRQFIMFDCDCVIDFDEKPYTIEKDKLLRSQANIIEKGKLNEQTMHMIYKKFLQSGSLSKMEMLDLHSSFNKAGITGLKKPK
ncbi:MAG: hypothetical protein EG826_15140 [Deltaproteobacteria bacterium]|nr:hypothetical protein [Deltaproteobacteria bacterium]